MMRNDDYFIKYDVIVTAILDLSNWQRNHDFTDTVPTIIDMAENVWQILLNASMSEYYTSVYVIIL